MTKRERTADRVKELQTCFGGYWRYPDVLDYYYLVNPFFPPRKLSEEFEKNFYQLLIQYPSGMRVNSALAAENFGVNTSEILVGNGAAELISCLMQDVSGRVGLLYPSFEEYANRLLEGCRVPYYAKGPNYTYTVNEIIEFYSKRRNAIKTLVIVNPDNPSGNFISKKEMVRLLCWTKTNGIRLVIDESFVDFADKSYSLINHKILSEYENLVVIKSISKSYGVPGLRLGVLASGNLELIARMKKKVAIWNINSFAEFYMQIAPKYKKDFRAAYRLFKKERSRFYRKLQGYPFLRVLPSQANYFLAEVLPPYTANELCCKLYESEKVLAKNCGGKKGFDGKQYLRVTIRNTVDNDKFLAALGSI